MDRNTKILTLLVTERIVALYKNEGGETWQESVSLQNFVES